MDYRFEISLPDSSEFRCEIAIAGEQTFQQLHDKIVEVLEYDASQMASFYMVDKMGNRGKEIALMDMSEDEEESDTLVMDSTTIAEVISPSCIELEYVYDFFNNKYFKVEYAGEYIADSADILPVCVYCDGNIPEQSGFGPGEDWGFEKSDEEYDDSFMEEFNDYSDERDFGDDEGDDYGDDEDGYGRGGGRYDDRYESIDDYLDKL